MSEWPTIEWTRPKLKRFVKAYLDARDKSQESFTFEGHHFLTTYAKYLIEFLTSQLGGKI